MSSDSRLSSCAQSDRQRRFQHLLGRGSRPRSRSHDSELVIRDASRLSNPEDLGRRSSLGQRRALSSTPTKIRCPSKRLAITLNKFTAFALPLHLEVIRRHRYNIEQLLLKKDLSSVEAELDLTSRSVRQLGSLIYEMEVLRSYVDPNDLAYFDSKVIPAKTSALMAIQSLREAYPMLQELSSSAMSSSSSSFSSRPATSSASIMRASSTTTITTTATTTTTMKYEFAQIADEETCKCGGQESIPILSEESLTMKSFPTQKSKSENIVYNKDPDSSSINSSSDIPGQKVVLRQNKSSSAKARVLSILYEHPKEDCISVLSGNDEDLAALCNLMEAASKARHEEDEKRGQTHGRNRAVKDPPEVTLGKSWRNLETEISDFQQLIAEFSRIKTKKDHTRASVAKDQSDDDRGCHGYSHQEMTKSTLYPVAGALLGTFIGGPVGMLAGVKLGGLAALGGSVFGYSTGILIKEQKDRKDYIDDFYASHPDLPKPAIQMHRDTKRTQSLPDVFHARHHLGDSAGQSRSRRDLRSSGSMRVNVRTTRALSVASINRNNLIRNPGNDATKSADNLYG